MNMKNTIHKWYRLDNAAIIVPSTAKGSDTRVFRLVCELKEEVDGGILQEALDETLEEYPHLNVVLREGLFWHYLDGTALRPVVEEDHLPACAPLYRPGQKNLLYRVSDFGKRINLEVLHVLADGTGAFSILKHQLYGSAYAFILFPRWRQDAFTLQKDVSLIRRGYTGKQPCQCGLA